MNVGMRTIERILLGSAFVGACAGLSFFATEQVLECWDARSEISTHRIENAVTIQELENMKRRLGL
jgi:hypothetical protein